MHRCSVERDADTIVIDALRDADPMVIDVVRDGGMSRWYGMPATITVDIVKDAAIATRRIATRRRRPRDTLMGQDDGS